MGIIAFIIQTQKTEDKNYSEGTKIQKSCNFLPGCKRDKQQFRINMETQTVNLQVCLEGTGFKKDS